MLEPFSLPTPSLKRLSARTRLAVASAVALFIGMSLSIIPAATVPLARAAELGQMVTIAGWPIGTFRTSTGLFAYCAEPGAWTPTSEQAPPASVAELPAYVGTANYMTGWSNSVVVSGSVTGVKMRALNYLMSTYGETASAEVAAAVQLAVWIVRGDPGAAAWLQYHLNWVSERGGGIYVQRAHELAAEALQRGVAPVAPTPAPLVLRAAEVFGEGYVDYPAGTTELRLSGAVFADGSARIVVDESAAGTAKWRTLLHPDGWLRQHEVRIEGDWHANVEGWQDRLTLHQSFETSQQRLVTGTGTLSVEFRGSYPAVTTLVDAQFSPQLSTQTPVRFIDPNGERFSDTVRVFAASDSNPWPSTIGADGLEKHLPLLLEGVVYGPFAMPPVENAEVPPGAPVAGRTTVLADGGPGVYEVSSSAPPDETGYYSWVWTVAESSQVPELRATGLLPPEYRFTDAFGKVEEGQVLATRLRWQTELLERQIPVSDVSLTDRVTVSVLRGAWLRDASGQRVPARIRLTVYQSDTRPTRSAEAPVHAREIAQSWVVIDGPGRAVESERILLPGETRGWVSVRSCLLAEDQPEHTRGLIEEWCDDYGVPEETARIVVPDPPLEELATTGTGGAGFGWFAALAGGVAVSGGLLCAGGQLRNRQSGSRGTRH